PSVEEPLMKTSLLVSPRLFLAACVGVCAAAIPATAETLFAVAPFTGPKAAKVRQQLAEALCLSATCASEAAVTSHGKLDWKKVHRLDAKVVSGRIVKERTQTRLDLAVLDSSAAVKLTTHF